MEQKGGYNRTYPTLSCPPVQVSNVLRSAPYYPRQSQATYHTNLFGRAHSERNAVEHRRQVGRVLHLQILDIQFTVARWPVSRRPVVGDYCRRLLRDFKVLRYTLDAIEIELELCEDPVWSDERPVTVALSRTDLLHQLAGRFGEDL